MDTTNKNGSSTVKSQPSQQPRPQNHNNHHEHHDGKEQIIPLTRRTTLHRLDVCPFLIGYFILILFDVYYHHYHAATDQPTAFSSSYNNDTSATTVSVSAVNNNNNIATILIDILYTTLLIIQLIIFLKCQWDPIFYSQVAFRKYAPQSSSSSSSSSAVVAKKKKIIMSIHEKIVDMKCWTHCLVIPPNPYNNLGSGDSTQSGNVSIESGRKEMSKKTNKQHSKKKANNNNNNNNNMQTVRPERPGIVPLKVIKEEFTTTEGNEITSFVAMIHFRGWTYRCCCNDGVDYSGGEHVDLPIESIWHKEGMRDGSSTLGKVGDEIEEDDEGLDASTKSLSTRHYSASSKTATMWEPQFHRLNFPTNLPLQFYSQQWTGHDNNSKISSSSSSTSTSKSTTLDTTQEIYGRNTTSIPLPPYLSLLTQQLLQPMFLFQLLCVLLWSLDEYWMYALLTLGTLVLFESMQALNRWKSVKHLREEVGGGGSESEKNGGKMKKSSNKVECYRGREWMTLPTNELVVGDIISLVSPSIHNKQQQTRAVRNAHDHDRGCTIPADLLLLTGRAVVNEAMLTGESVPQVKESIEVEEEEEQATAKRLDLSDGSTHKRSVLFGGTVLMDHHSSVEEEGYGGGNNQASSSSNKSKNNGIPTPPNQGLVCFVLRTGFDTIQGSLLRTLAYHAESGSGGNGGGGEGVNAKETLLFLLILLLCALASATTVVRHAWGDVTRNHFKLILHIVIIITSVIPPELPMELSLAVTTSLSELVKRYQVYCTEPFRIPLAGLVDTCCFDKTGTLTSDELRLHGVRLPTSTVTAATTAKKGGDDEDLILFDDILSKEKSENDITGSSKTTTIRSILPRDTLRVMIGCQSLAVTHVFVPGRNGRTTVQTELCGDPLEKAVMEGCGFTIHPRTDMVVEKESLVSNSGEGGGSIKVLHRFAFSSKLRRMSVLATDSESDALWALAKGAPEALKPMLDVESLPDDYEQSYLRHMTLGRRVLALAYRKLGTNTPATLAKWKTSRDGVEQKLTFAGLLIMDSPLKSDSARVIKELRGGNQNVVMVTGDAVLTAAEVARRVGIVDTTQECTYELCHEVKSSSNGQQQEREQFVFRRLDHSVIGANTEDDKDWLLYTPSNYQKLEAMVQKEKANFCVTGDVLTKLANHAVKEATLDKNSFAIDDRAVLNHPAAKTALSNLVPIISVFARHAPRHKEAVIAAFNSAGRHTLMCGDGTNDVGALKKAHVGVSIISVPDLEAKQRSANDVISAAKAEEKKERKAAKKKDGKCKSSSSSSNRNNSKRSRADRVNRSLQALAEAEDELNYVSLGNASVASPFTSRKTSVRCCKDILQQGRCTLVTMIQIYKILGVQCLVNALVLTTLHQKGVKQGDRQLTAVGVVVAILFLFVTRGKPLPKLSTQKPPSSVLCTETMISIAVQFGIHFVAIMSVTFISDAYVDPYDPSTVPDGPFHPNTLNTGKSAFFFVISFVYMI